MFTMLYMLQWMHVYDALCVTVDACLRWSTCYSRCMFTMLYVLQWMHVYNALRVTVDACLRCSMCYSGCMFTMLYMLQWMHVYDALRVTVNACLQCSTCYSGCMFTMLYVLQWMHVYDDLHVTVDACLRCSTCYSGCMFTMLYMLQWMHVYRLSMSDMPWVMVYSLHVTHWVTTQIICSSLDVYIFAINCDISFSIARYNCLVVSSIFEVSLHFTVDGLTLMFCIHREICFLWLTKINKMN